MTTYATMGNNENTLEQLFCRDRESDPAIDFDLAAVVWHGGWSVTRGLLYLRNFSKYWKYKLTLHQPQQGQLTGPHLEPCRMRLNYCWITSTSQRKRCLRRHSARREDSRYFTNIAL
ncbi:hypothetical protein CCR75_007571 [Bremia lactucae]|uniref:Uncharacterized protein n=1 Tax=Bremia lactucae TaxID=4779 RepID=A0A976IA27_BRELC|nr:hypothetical protein CCR75_007571 [Bremia lactucae]